MHEVEVKSALKDKQAFIAALSERGSELGPEIVQDDTVYVKNTGSLATYLNNSDFLRLRVENTGRTLFTFKRHTGTSKDLTSAPLELELEVSSREEMEKILILLGYKAMVRVKKVRRKTQFEKWEICVDEVEGLGSFVELEELSEVTENTQEIRNRMQAFLAELGVGGEEQLNNRYDVLLLLKQGLQ
jgi:adenylate cyclase class 2